jgi:hypothetical protein
VGTGNRLVPLGDHYVEIIAVIDPSASSPIAEAVRAWTAGGDRLVGVSLAVDDIDEVEARIGGGVVPISRTRLDGQEINFRVAGLLDSIATGRPFFIEWGDGGELRTGDPVTHPCGATAITWVDLGGDPAEMRDWLGADVPGLRLVGGPPGAQACGIATAAGELVLR